MKRLIVIGLSSMLLAACAPIASGPSNPGSDTGAGTHLSGTVHNHSITSSETWQKGVHVVDGDIEIEGDNSPVVTIEPGCVIKFTNGSRLSTGYSKSGGLIAQGTATESITFTSNNTTGNAGDYIGLHFYSSTNSSQTKLSNCVIEYAGGGSEEASVTSDGATTAPAFDHVTVRHGKGWGFKFYDQAKAAAFTNNTVTDVTGVPVSLGANSLGSLGVGNALTGNGIDVLEVIGGNVNQSATWATQSVPFRVQGEINVSGTNSSSNPVLTLTPGSTFQMGQDADFNVGYGNPGTLNATGTSAAHIVFTGLPNNTTAGQWQGVAFYDRASGANSTFNFVDIRYAGGGTRAAALYTDVTLTNFGNITIDNVKTGSVGFTAATATTTNTTGTITFGANVGTTITPH